MSPMLFVLGHEEQQLNMELNCIFVVKQTQIIALDHVFVCFPYIIHFVNSI